MQMIIFEYNIKLLCYVTTSTVYMWRMIKLLTLLPAIYNIFYSRQHCKLLHTPVYLYSYWKICVLQPLTIILSSGYGEHATMHTFVVITLTQCTYVYTYTYIQV